MHSNDVNLGPVPFTYAKGHDHEQNFSMRDCCRARRDFRDSHAGGRSFAAAARPGDGWQYHAKSIRQYQFAQTHRDRIEVRLQSARPLTDHEARAVIDWAQAKFGDAFRIVLAFPADLPRTASGKFEDFISLLG